MKTNCRMEPLPSQWSVHVVFNQYFKCVNSSACFLSNMWKYRYGFFCLMNNVQEIGKKQKKDLKKNRNRIIQKKVCPLYEIILLFCISCSRFNRKDTIIYFSFNFTKKYIEHTRFATKWKRKSIQVEEGFVWTKTSVWACYCNINGYFASKGFWEM